MKIGIVGPISNDLLLDSMGLPKEKMPEGLRSPNVTNLINGLWEMGHKIVVFSLSRDQEKPVSFYGNRITVCYSKYRYRLRAVDAFREERRGLLINMHDHPVDVMHAHWSYEFAMAALKMDKNALVTLHDWAPQVLLFMPNYYRAIRLLMNYYVLFRSRYLLANSQYIAKNLYRFKTKLLGYVYNPITVNPKGNCKKSNRIIAVNNGFNAIKNVATLIDAFVVVKEMVADAELHLYGHDYGIGEGAYAWTESKYGCVKGIKFEGEVPYETVLEKMEEAIILVHPSREESFGNVLVEAMFCKTAVIGGDRSGAVPEVLGYGKAGVLEDIGSANLLAKAIVNLMEDERRRKALVERAYEYAMENFSVQRVSERHSKIYQKILDENP